MHRIICYLVEQGIIERIHRGLWVTHVDGEGWGSARDAAIHALRFLIGA